MRILQLITTLDSGGAEKLVTDMVQLMNHDGIECDLILLKDNESPFRRQLENNSKIKVKALAKTHLYNPILIFKLIPYLKRYDLVHGHLFPTIYWMVLAKWFSFSKTKIVFTEHSTSNRRRNSLFFKWVERILYRGVDRLVSVSENVNAELRKHLNYKDSNTFTTISNGIDILHYKMAEGYPKDQFFNKNDFFLIQVSSFRPQKDQQTIIRAMQILPADIKLLLVGDGPLKKQYEDLVKSEGLENRVRFLGNRTDVAELLHTSDVVILSSFYEGFGLASIEGMACSKPTIASNVPGSIEVVGGSGILFERGNEKELAKIILELKNDRNYYNKIKFQCLKRAEEYDIHKMVREYIELYRRLIF